MGGGLVDWSACVGMGDKAPLASLLGLQGIHFSGTKATFAANPFGHREATLRMWTVGFDGCLGKLAATWSWAPPSNTLVALGSPGSLCVPLALPQLGVHILQLLCRHDKIRSPSVTARMDLENTEQCEVRCTCRAPLSSEHPTVLRTDLPEAALCRDLSWARCGAWAEFSGAYDIAIPKRVEPGGDTAKDLHAPQNFRTGWIHSFFPWRKRTPAAQIRNTVNPLLWFIKTITLILPECIFSRFLMVSSSSSSLKSCGLTNG